MSTAYRCDLTGEITAGKGVSRLTVDLGDLRLIVVPRRRTGNNQFEDGDLSPAAAQKIATALKTLAPAANRAASAAKS